MDEINKNNKNIKPTDASASTTGNADGQPDSLNQTPGTEVFQQIEVQAAVEQTTNPPQNSGVEEPLKKPIFPMIDQVPQELGSETSETDTETLESDQLSLCSDRSGATIIGKSMNKMDVGDRGPFIKLKSAEKRRFRKAIADGLTREQALKFAQDPPPRTTKRALSDEKAFPVGKKPKPDTCAAKPKTVNPTYSSVVGTVKLGFVPNDLSLNPLTTEQMALLQEAIIDITNDLGDDVRPEFEGCFPRTGWFMVACSNRKTADFLIRNIQAMKDISKMEFNIVEESMFPRSHFVRGYFPHSLDLPNEGDHEEE